jgi:hypothetical protein
MDFLKRDEHHGGGAGSHVMFSFLFYLVDGIPVDPGVLARPGDWRSPTWAG